MGAGDIAHGDLLRVPYDRHLVSARFLGRRAAELLLERLDAEVANDHQRIVIPPRLVVRASSGADHETGVPVST